MIDLLGCIMEIIYLLVVEGYDREDKEVVDKLEGMVKTTGLDSADIMATVDAWLKELPAYKMLNCVTCSEKNGCDQVKYDCPLIDHPLWKIFTDEIWSICNRGMEKLKVKQYLSDPVFQSQLGAVPPKLYKEGLFQCGEPHSSDETGALTYFSAVYNETIKLWQFVGNISTKRFLEDHNGRK